MSLLDFFYAGRFKRELAEANAKLAALTDKLGDALVADAVQLREKIVAEEQRLSNLSASISESSSRLSAMSAEIQNRSKDLVQLDDEILLQEFGLYRPKYKLVNSAAYKQRIESIRAEQSKMIKEKSAASAATNWSLNGNEREGKKMIADYVKLILRAFNNECDSTIEGVKFSNLDACRKRIGKSYDVLNRLGARMGISIKSRYRELKIEELELCHEYQVKKQEEKEELRRVREREREEAKLAREIEEARQTLAKEEKHFQNAQEKLRQQLAKASSEAERTLCEKELFAIDAKLSEIDAQKKDVDYREAHAKAGYVYVISNIGAFGEGVYKIGVTRRLNPSERIDELGDASVPFDFDVHALVFSENAFGLESALHQKFETSRINRINLRKEFFRAPLDEIESTLLSHFEKPVEFVRLADAIEYRESLKMTSPASSN